MGPTDNELMQRLQGGDAGSLGTLFERYQARLANYFRRLTPGQEVAGDLVQNVFLRILRYRDSFRDDGEFRVWLYRLARNSWIDHRRETAGEAAALELSVDPPGDEPLPSDRFDEQQRSALVRRALAALPADRRELLILSRFEGFKAPQIAWLLGCSPGAVRVRIHRALGELRQRIEALSKEAAS